MIIDNFVYQWLKCYEMALYISQLIEHEQNHKTCPMYLLLKNIAVQLLTLDKVSCKFVWPSGSIFIPQMLLILKKHIDWSTPNSDIVQDPCMHKNMDNVSIILFTHHFIFAIFWFQVEFVIIEDKYVFPNFEIPLLWILWYIITFHILLNNLENEIQQTKFILQERVK